MIVQWCLKGMALPDDDAARRILRDGLISNWGRSSGQMRLDEFPTRLTDDGLDRHVHGFEDPDPQTGNPFHHTTPFISLSCGTIERDKFARTNIARTARWTALRFGLNSGRSSVAYLFRCWVVVSPRQSTSLIGLAEDVGNLRTYRNYSRYQLEGEVAAKLWVPPNQIQEFERWTYDRNSLHLERVHTEPNPAFVDPAILTNVRELI